MDKFCRDSGQKIQFALSVAAGNVDSDRSCQAPNRVIPINAAWDILWPRHPMDNGCNRVDWTNPKSPWVLTMIIPVLPSLQGRSQWIAFCRRERPYCYVREPDTLVDMQSTFLIITLLGDHVRDGRQATKFSIGTRTSLQPAWQFIQACNFDLRYMVNGLQQVRFDGNARDNSRFRAADNVSIRKFFSKEAALLSSAAIGPLEPLQQLPERWSLLHTCQLLANEQFDELRCEGQLPAPGSIRTAAAIDGQQLLLRQIESPQPLQPRWNGERLQLCQGDIALYSLRPNLRLDSLRRAEII